LSNSNIKNILTKAIGIFLVAFFTLLNSYNTSAQSTFKNLMKLSCPEKRWVLFHPLIAKNVFKISVRASQKATELKSDSTLDGDLNGGQLDAFRHAYWMARITQDYGWKRAHSLGNAHEKGNFRDFKKRRLEEGSMPDKESCEMDYLNNDVGIQIGKDNLLANFEELSKKIIESIINGKLFIIKKNITGAFLNCNDEVISNKNNTNVWKTEKCIVPSNYKKNKN
jgi:hypothetical protein